MSNITLKRTHSENNDFIKLVSELTRYLSIVDGEDHDFYNQYNGLEALHHVVIAYDQKLAIGCGAFKAFDPESIEIKRMFVAPETRGKRVGTKILNELEQWATEENYTKSYLETGKRMPDAIALYEKNGYQVIPNYGPYIGVDNSKCFLKNLND